MRQFVGNDQAYLVVDTTQRQDSAMVILRAMDATPIFWSQERSDLESNLDAGGNPQSGMLMLNTDPPMVLIGARVIVWARAAAQTRIEVQVVSQRVGITSQAQQPVNIPGSAPSARGRRNVFVRVPNFEDSWTKKGGVQ